MYNAKINESFYISSAKLEIISKQFTKSKQLRISRRTEKRIYTKEVYQKVDFTVGVDGFEPPTLCL